MEIVLSMIIGITIGVLIIKINDILESAEENYNFKNDKEGEK